MDRTALADFLRHRRASLTPEDVGLARTPRRRTAGLRREEVASLAVMSTDYYTRLEQGRGPQPSPAMLTALTRGLRLTRLERDHLFRLAGHVPPRSDGPGDHVAPGIRRVLDRLDTPVMVTNDLGEVLAQNRAAVALLGDESRFADGDPRRSRILRWFTDPAERDAHPVEDAGEYSRSYVSTLRLAAGRRPDDPRVTELVRTLQGASVEFDELWEAHEVTGRPRSQRKVFLHSEVGRLELDCEVLHADDDAQVVLVYSAEPGSPSADKLRLLEIAGTTSAGGARA